MNEPYDQDLSADEMDAAGAKVSRKRASKTAAKKSSVKKVAKKAVRKMDAEEAVKVEVVAAEVAVAEGEVKVPKKRAAKKAAKVKEAAAEMELPLGLVLDENQAEAEVKVPKKRAAKKAARKVVEEAPEVEIHLETVLESEEGVRGKRPRYGRVPGGGPTQGSVDDGGGKSEISEVVAPQADKDDLGGQSSAEAGEAGAQKESRSKRRREKRKRRKQQLLEQQNAGVGAGSPPAGGQSPAPQAQAGSHQGSHQGRHAHQGARQGGQSHGQPRQGAAGGRQMQGGGRVHQTRQKFEHKSEFKVVPLSGPKIDTDGMLEIAPKGFGFLRVQNKGYEQARDDVFVAPETIRKNHLRHGQWIHGNYQVGSRGAQLVDVLMVNGMEAEKAAKLPHFDELKAINPSKRISFETTPERFTTRVLDIMAPIGRGQRGLIVSPPRSGKTTLMLHMAEAIMEKYDDTIHLMVLLVDERPEEVTEFRRALPGVEIYASSNDEQARNHCRIAELAIERAKRLVESGKDVFLLMDSITRLARAYNNTMNQRGRGTGTGGITIGALEVPRRLFAAARNTREAGSLTIMATALIQTNSRADEAIFMEFKGTGNMELVLDRKIAENYLYPAVDIFKSGTRREELLLPGHMLHKINLVRRGLSGHRPVEAMERLLFFLKKFSNNPQMLLEIKG